MTEQKPEKKLLERPTYVSVDVGSAFPEAPAIAFTQLYGRKNGQVIQINHTERALTGMQALDNIMAVIIYAKEKYNLDTVKPDISVPPPPKKETATPDTANTSVPKQTPQTSIEVPSNLAPLSPAPLASPSATQGELLVCKMDIVPEAEDKVTLKFYAAGHNHPDLSSNKRPSGIVLRMLQGTGEDWTEKDLWRASTRSVNYRVRWQFSQKTNSAGNPFKNIVQILAA